MRNILRKRDTTSCAVTPGGLLQLGRSKDHRPDLPQLLVMAAAVEPAGHCLGVDVHPGQRADDGCYLPLIERMRPPWEKWLRWLGRQVLLGYAVSLAMSSTGTSIVSFSAFLAPASTIVTGR